MRLRQRLKELLNLTKMGRIVCPAKRDDDLVQVLDILQDVQDAAQGLGFELLGRRRQDERERPVPVELGQAIFQAFLVERSEPMESRQDSGLIEVSHLILLSNPVYSELDDTGSVQVPEKYEDDFQPA
jgi:hypothetical protein